MTAVKSKTDNMQGNRRVLAWLVAIAFFMQMLDGTILNTALPAIARSLGANPLRMQSVVISYMLTVAFLIPVSGWLADFFGTKKVFISAIFIFTLGSLACAMSQTLWQLVLARVFQGVGGALMVPVGRLAVMRVFPKAEMISALSFITIPGLVGPLVGPILGGVIVYYINWHWIFLINLPIGVVCALLTRYFMPKVKPMKMAFDWPGYFFFSAAVILMSLSLASAEGVNISARTTALMFLAGAFFMLAYARFSFTRPWRALFKPRLFYERSFAVGIIANIFLRFAAGALPFLGPLMLQVGLGFSALKAGLMMIPMGITSIWAKTLIEGQLNRFGYKKFMIFNTMIIGMLISCYSLINVGTSVIFILTLFGVLGVFNSMQFTALNTLTLIAVPQRDLSQANSLLSAVMQLSISLGVGVAGAVLAFFNAHNYYAQGSDKLMYAFHATYLFVGIFTILAASLFLTPFARNIVDKPSQLQ
ncbi:MAG: MFS transporter [Elusimicrobium sp.]|jgi:EmrB/QacA subfamily drug resistance transporter|nr:MFS transporter [Elusimicrobium sp.]